MTKKYRKISLQRNTIIASNQHLNPFSERVGYTFEKDEPAPIAYGNDKIPGELKRLKEAED